VLGLSLQYAVRMGGEVENIMTSVERIVEYKHLQSEEKKNCSREQQLPLLGFVPCFLATWDPRSEILEAETANCIDHKSQISCMND